MNGFDGYSANVSAAVKEIDSHSIKLLAAGEKINDIETACRELIENSIDAGASNIEVRLTKFGVDSIEVEDDGCGIDEAYFDSIGLRYHTSKISDYQALQQSLETFGFRGEALSCLCNMATVTIITKTRSSPTGWKLTFKKDGILNKKEPTHRNGGTTVILKNIFHSFPVRRKELEKTAKKQYDKIVKLIYEQVMARPEIKFTLSKKVVVRKEKDFTHGGTTLEGCLTTIFGLKLLESLLPIKQIIKGQLLLQLEGNHKPALQSDSDIILITDPNATFETKLTSTQAGNIRVKYEPIEVKEENGLSSANGNGEDGDLVDGEDRSDSTQQVLETTTNQTRDQNSSEREEASQVLMLGAANGTGSQTISTRSSRNEFFKRSCRSRFARQKPIYKVHGYISKLNCGRNSTDGQYLFVNRKPCEIPKLSRGITEVYRNFCNTNNQPFYCVFIEVQTWAADFNVPRKRAVILQDENNLIDIVRESLEEMYSSFAPASQKLCPIAQIPFASTPKISETSFRERGQLSSQSTEESQETGKRNEEVAISVGRDNLENHNNFAVTMGNTSSEISNEIPIQKDAIKLIIPSPKDAQNQVNSDKTSNAKFDMGTTCSKDTTSTYHNGITQSNKRPHSPIDQDLLKSTKKTSHNKSSIHFEPFPISGNLISENPISENFKTHHIDPKRTSKPNRNELLQSCRLHQVNGKVNGRLQASIQYIEDLKTSLARERLQREMGTDQRQFSFAIHPKFNAPAEEELKFHLNKSSFKEMLILGQFNRGFIIARLNKHIFIIDQHATDERANYEQQLEHSPLVKQPMVLPKPLYLNLIQENAILNNMDAFVKRGFEFLVDQSKLIGYRVRLTSTSICKGPTKDEYLGKEDIEELVDVAIESPNRLESYILSKVRTVSASVACRKSVMIGDSLTWQQMTDIVTRMSDLKNPWVCAHNRPTIRHLMDIDWMNKN